MQITHKRQESSRGAVAETEAAAGAEKSLPAATRACHLMSQLKFNAKLIQARPLPHPATHTHTYIHHPSTPTHEQVRAAFCVLSTGIVREFA